MATRYASERIMRVWKRASAYIKDKRKRYYGNPQHMPLLEEVSVIKSVRLIKVAKYTLCDIMSVHCFVFMLAPRPPIPRWFVLYF